jgi:chemosensory pili system protein ChpC
LDNDQAIIRAILAPLAEGSILVPNNVVAEVIEFTTPVPYEHGPSWLLGEMEWKGWQVPIISFAALSGARERDTVSSASRILIIKTLTEEVSLYYVGILIKGLPKLKKLPPGSLQTLSEGDDAPVIFCRVTLEDQTAMIPELDALTRCIAEALYEQ